MSNDSEKEAMRIYAIAHAIAEKAHAGQFRNLPDGRPYIEHCKDVAALMPTWELKTVAILHDAIEDTREQGHRGSGARGHGSTTNSNQVTAESLLGDGIPKVIVDAVVAMTKPKDADYAEYVRTQVKGNELAKKVKLADNYLNLKDRIACVIAGGPEAEEHRKAIAKYAAGMGILAE